MTLSCDVIGDGSFLVYSDEGIWQVRLPAFHAKFKNGRCTIMRFFLLDRDFRNSILRDH